MKEIGLSDWVDKADRPMDKAGIQKMLGALMAVCWVLFSVTLVIRLTAGDGEYLASQMLRYTVPEETGLPEAEYSGVGNMIADYLTGKTKEFRYTVTGPDGEAQECFQSREQAHMADCRKLISDDEAAAAASGITALVLLACSLIAEKDRQAFFRGIILGLRIVLGAALLPALWAAADFDGLFVTFHRIAFTNDLWLLNPASDMLIRLMPTEFFVGLGIRGAVLVMIIPILLAVTARIGLRKTGSGNKHDV